MTVEYLIQSQPQHPHETQAILTLAQLMQRTFAAGNHFYILAANVRFWRAQADALVLAPHAIVIIELKSCSDPVLGRADGSWQVSPGGERIPGGSYVNPYYQVVATRNTLIKYLNRNRYRFLTEDRAQETAGHWGHVSAAIVFSPYWHPDSDIATPPESRAWLGVIGLNEVAEFLFSRFSPKINLSPQELRYLAVEALHCRPWTDIEPLLYGVPNLGHLWLLDEAGRQTYAFPIVDGATIGRSRDNVLVTPPRFSLASRRHAHLRLIENTVWLYDDNSTHGTCINGQAIAPGQGQPLHDGDLITLGSVGHPGACQLYFEYLARFDIASRYTPITAQF